MASQMASAHDSPVLASGRSRHAPKPARRSAKSGAYGESGSVTSPVRRVALGKSVSIIPGSIITTRTPNGAISTDRASDSALRAYFDAW